MEDTRFETVLVHDTKVHAAYSHCFSQPCITTTANPSILATNVGLYIILEQRLPTNLGDPDVFEVPSLETEQFRAGYLVLLEGVAVHGEADGLQPLRHLVRAPLYDDLKQATKQLIDDKK